MNKTVKICLYAVLTFGVVAQTLIASQQDPGPFLGDWMGTISPGYDVVFHFMLDAEKKISGTVDVPAEGVIGDVLTDIKIDGRNISFNLPGAPGNPLHKGVLDESEKKMAMTIFQNGREMNLILTKG